MSDRLWVRNLKYPKKTTDLSQVTSKLEIMGRIQNMDFETET